MYRKISVLIKLLWIVLVSALFDTSWAQNHLYTATDLSTIKNPDLLSIIQNKPFIYLNISHYESILVKDSTYYNLYYWTWHELQVSYHKIKPNKIIAWAIDSLYRYQSANYEESQNSLLNLTPHISIYDQKHHLIYNNSYRLRDNTYENKLKINYLIHLMAPLWHR